MTCVTCRRVLIPDLPDVVALDHRCFGGLWSEAAYRREVDSPNSDLLLLEGDPAVDGAQTVIGIGCSWAILEEAHITILGIAPESRGLGLGKGLLIALLQAAISRGLAHATLEVRASNHVAQSLYRQLGFQIAGERRHYYADGESALILWKNGLQYPDFTKTLKRHRDRLSPRLHWCYQPVQTEGRRLTPEG
jgi:ribosomal-protein-alanine N-acetyltransferase